MIGYLRGDILEHSEGRLLVVTGGVGYAVAVPNSAAYLGMTPGKATELFIHTHVREDALDLYGFATRIEKELFLSLTSISGIGPKVAMSLLSAADPDALMQAILDGDTATMTKIPGVGKKTAERIVLELGDKLRKKQVQAGPGAAKLLKAAVKGGGVYDDARAALLGLGYKDQEVASALKRVQAELGESSPAKAEELVRVALRRLL